MEISLAMVLDTLSISYINFADHKQKTNFRQVKRLSELKDAPCPDTLYIGTKDQLKLCSLLQFKPYTLCIPDKLPLKEADCIHENTVYFTELISLQELYFRVNECFDKLNAWDFRLYQSTIHGEGFQALLDAGNGIFKNHIHIVEPFSKLLAYTKEIDIEEVDLDAMYSENIQKSSSIKELQDTIYGHLKTSKSDIVLMNHNSVYIHPSVTKAVSKDDSYTVYVIMICKYRKFSEGVKDLFLHLCKYVKYYAQKNNVMKKNYVSHDIFFHGALNRTFSDHALNIHATLTLKLPSISNFNLYNITLANPDENTYDQLMEILYHQLPDSRLSRFQDNILLLNHYQEKDIREKHLLNLRKIEPVINRFQCTLGISHPFKSLLEITHAYDQTVTALNFNNRNRLNALPFILTHSGGPFFHYDDYSLSHTLLEICRHDPKANSLAPYIDNIISIKEYDQQHQTKCIPLLFKYLTLERNTSESARQLGLSDEDVIHYIHVIERLIHGDLNSWRIRVKLLLTFEYLNLTPESLISDEI